MKVYIAGPMTGYEEFNYPAFYRAEEELQQLGFTCVNPARLDEVTTLDLLEAGYDPDAPGGLGDGSALPVYLRRDFKELVQCEGLVLLDGWRYSPGANAELLVARLLDFNVWVLSEKDRWRLYVSAAMPNEGVVRETLIRFAQPRWKEQLRTERKRWAAV